MNRRMFAIALSVGTALMFAPRLALAESHHLADAITHTKQAIEHGKMGQADVLVTHAEEALKHAKAAEAEKPNPHTKEGITHLDQAIENGKMKHADVATKHAEEALTHFEAATK
jgi:Small metal-binding protein